MSEYEWGKIPNESKGMEDTGERFCTSGIQSIAEPDKKGRFHEHQHFEVVRGVSRLKTFDIWKNKEKIGKCWITPKGAKMHNCSSYAQCVFHPTNAKKEAV